MKYYNIFILIFLFILSHALPHSALATTYEFRCKVDKKLGFNREYSKENINKYKYSLIIRELNSGETVLSRCDAKAPCDEYKVDRTEFSPQVKIIKYYYFRGQFDVQIFGDGRFIENNGRGTLSFGQCTRHTFPQ